MADWSKILSRGKVEDRRGSPLAFAGGGISLLAVGAVLLFNLLAGGDVDLGSVLGQLSNQSMQTSLTSEEYEGLDSYEEFTSAVLGSNNEMWAEIFRSSGRSYSEPKVVLFRSATQSKCGVASSQVGPHYCPADATIYIDETFYDELQKRFGAQGGDVAEAYVLSHEVGHHVQQQLGIMDGMNSSSNEDSIKLELQADCFAGVWAHSIRDLGIFEAGEIKEAIDAAGAVGDDRIQSKTQGQVNPETWTHGSSEERIAWFTKGYQNGNPASCDTFL